MPITDFNSMMVRLEDTSIDLYGITINEFQFHDGAIGSDVPGRELILIHPFQFHDGAIGRALPVNLNRLYLKFQFHDGAIGSWIAWYNSQCPRISIP